MGPRKQASLRPTIRAISIVLAVLAVLASHAAHGATATFELSSPKDGSSVRPGEAIPWSIRVSLSPGDSAGLALVSVDLYQSPSNPDGLDLSPAGGVPAGLEMFSRTAGISNPGAAGLPTGFPGTPGGVAGRRNLFQIGGAQNTFGKAGSRMGQNPVLVPGIGQAGPIVLAEGSFLAPHSPGAYRFLIENGMASALKSINPLPGHSTVEKATVALGKSAILFTVASSGETAFVRGDINGDGKPDLTDAVLLLGHLFLNNPATLDCLKSADCDGNGATDISDPIFLLGYLFLGGSRPPPPHPGCGTEGKATPLSCDQYPLCR